MLGKAIFDPARIGVGDPNHAVRNYDLSRMTPLVGLLDNPMYPPYVEDTPHTHNCMEIGVCLSGRGTITVGGRTWQFAAGTVAVAPKDVFHAQQNTGDPMTHWHYVLVNTEVLLMETPPHRREDVAGVVNRIPVGVFLGPEAVAADIRRVIESMFRAWHEGKSLDSMEMDAMTRLLLARLSWMPNETLIALPEGVPERMAAACAMSESYFRKLFGRVMGMSPVEYLNRYRVNRSIYFLYATDETVLSVAGLCGFASIASYNRNFLKYVGVSPTQWRRNAASEA